MGGFICAFCQRGGTRTREHLLRDKFRDLIPTFGAIERASVTYGSPVKRRRIPLSPFMLTVNEVCAECNGGWLNDLENEVEDILLDLIFGRARDVPEEQKEAVGLWMATRALLRTIQDGQTGRAPWVLFRDVYRHRRVPRTIFVHWAQSDRYVAAAGRNTWFNPDRADATAEQRSRVPGDHYVGLVSFGIQSLFFQVALSGGSRVSASMAASLLNSANEFRPNTFHSLAPVRTNAEDDVRGFLRGSDAEACSDVAAQALGTPVIHRPGASFFRRQ